MLDSVEGDDRRHAFLAGGGEMGAIMRARDWSNSSLGPPANWPQALRTAVRLILNTGHPMYIWWGADLACLYNDAYRGSIGPERHPGSLGLPGREVWAEIWDIIGPQVEQVTQGRGSIWRENALVPITRNGRREEVYWTYSYSPIDDEAAPHGVGGVLVVCAETTAQVVAAREATRQRDEFSRLFEQAPTFMAMLRGPDHRFELANPSYMRLVGDRPIVGLTVAQALPEAVAQGYLVLLDKVFATGIAYVANSARFAFQSSPGGPLVERFVDFVYQPIFDAEAAVTGIFVEGFDVTERKRAEDAVAELNASLQQRIDAATLRIHDDEAKIQLFFEHSSECFAIMSEAENGHFRYDEANPATLRLYGKPRDEVVGRLTVDVLGAEAAAHLDKAFADCLRAGAPYRYERIQGGSTVEGVATPAPTRPGEPRRIIVSARDATERRLLEAQLRHAQKLEAIGQLTGGLAHDFNNLLAGISGSLELAGRRRAEGRADSVDRYIEVAQTAAQRAAMVTQRLLAFGRRQTLDPRPASPNQIVMGMEELIRRTVGPGIELAVIAAPDAWPILVDSSQLDNALLNLCINARDAMPHGGKLKISTANCVLDAKEASERDVKPGDYVAISVSDTGVGMPVDVVQRVFDPFFTTKPLGEGTGLGLSMVYGFTRQSEGAVRVASEVGKGTTMCLYLPRCRTNENAATIALNAGSPNPSPSDRTILVVEDEPAVRMFVVDVLSDEGYRVLEARDGPSAIKVLDSGEAVNLVVTDVGLPGGMNGGQVSEAARALRPDVKTLFVTGYADHAVLNKKVVDNNARVLTKPFAVDDLTRAVRDLLGPD